MSTIIRFSALLCLVALMALAVNAGRARADWDGPTTPEMKEWFKSVRNSEGAWCCDDSESQPVDDYQWRGDHFDVTVAGQTFHVPLARVAEQPNKFGAALVWVWPKGSPISDSTIRCFLRGQEG